MSSATLNHGGVAADRHETQKFGAFPSALAIFGILALLLMIGAPLFLVPAEDATILFQYSDNLANTGAITYNSPGVRVEGATDFLWMVVLAGFRRLHISAFWATALINVVSALLIAAGLIYLRRKLAWRLSLKPWHLMLAVIGGLLFAPPIGAALAGFSVLPFAMLILAAAVCYLKGNDAILAMVCLVLCLVRPDGVVFAFPLIAFRLFARKQGALPRLLTYALFFVLPGLIYFIWRWHYFGQFLPLPFLVKSDTRRVLGIAVSQSNADILKYLIFDVILLPVALGSKLKERTNLFLLLSIGVIPTLFYLTMRLDQNVADRFFMYLLLCPAVLIAWNWDALRITRKQLGLLTVGLWIVLMAFGWFTWMSRFLSDGYKNNVVAIAQDLGHLPKRGTLALSEAGRIAYFSRWHTTDMWGLNTPEYAHHLLQPTDIERLNPDIVVLYYPQTHDDCRVDTSWQPSYETRTWPHLAANVITGLHAEGGYDLMMVPSSGYLRRAMHHFRPGAGEYQCWFVKDSSPQHEAIEHILERHGALPEATFAQIRFGAKAGSVSH